MEEGQIANEWITPGKIGRSSGKPKQDLKYGEVQIISCSRFSALSVSEEDESETQKVVE